MVNIIFDTPSPKIYHTKHDPQNISTVINVPGLLYDFVLFNYIQALYLTCENQAYTMNHSKTDTDVKEMFPIF